MPGPLVVDASVIVRLILPGPDQTTVQQLIGQWMADSFSLHAPSLCVYEITSALCKSVHFGQITTAQGMHALTLAQRLGIRLHSPDDALARAAYEWTLRLNRGAAYDSFYLALAESLRCHLWTADQKLFRTTHLPWVRLAGAAA